MVSAVYVDSRTKESVGTYHFAAILRIRATSVATRVNDGDKTPPTGSIELISRECTFGVLTRAHEKRLASSFEQTFGI